MKLVFLILKTLYCSNEYLISQNSFFIVTDREIKSTLLKDESFSDLITLADSHINLGPDYFWDIYFPKPFMYEFNCEKIRGLNAPVSIDFEGKILFRFNLKYDLQNIYLNNFVDSYNVLITNTLFSDEKHLNNIFMLSREAKNVENIRWSYKYLTCTNNLTPLYENILRSLFQYIQRTDNLTESIKNIGDEKIFSLVSKAKMSLTSISIIFIQNLSSLRFPIYHKLSDLPTKKKFEDEINEIFKSLEEVVLIYLRSKNKGSKEEIIIEISEVLDYINNVIIQDNSLTKCFETYDKLLMDLKMIETFVNNSINPKANTDSELISDCIIENVDKFINHYQSLLLDYHEIMEKIKFEKIFTCCFPRTSLEIDLSIKELESFCVDKLISNTLYSLIYHYEVDKTDFLFFSKTNYFSHIFSLRIIDNLELIRKVVLIFDISDEGQEKPTVEILRKKITTCDRILNTGISWKRILNDDKLNRIKSFNDLLKEEENQMTTLEKKITDVSIHSSNTDEDQITKTKITNEVLINLEIEDL